MFAPWLRSVLFGPRNKPYQVFMARGLRLLIDNLSAHHGSAVPSVRFTPAIAGGQITRRFCQRPPDRFYSSFTAIYYDSFHKGFVFHGRGRARCSWDSKPASYPVSRSHPYGQGLHPSRSPFAVSADQSLLVLGQRVPPCSFLAFAFRPRCVGGGDCLLAAFLKGSALFCLSHIFRL